MTTISQIAAHRNIQNIAKQVLAALTTTITPLDTEKTIADRATAMMRKTGITQTWYYECPALILLGSRSCLSISGRSYTPAQEVVGNHNLVTVDLSPMLDGIWGDCARSFFIEDGRATLAPKSEEFRAGQQFLTALHAQMRIFAKPETTFHALFAWTNEKISAAGFENIDFLQNVGHSIASSRDQRQYIEEGNAHCLGDVPFFTFEPHVRLVGGQWGFKHENIFYFDAALLATEL